MGFARCGVEGIIRKICKNIRKKLSIFSFFVILKNGKVFARDWFSSPLPVAVARTSQSPFPLAVSLKDENETNNLHIDIHYFDRLRTDQY